MQHWIERTVWIVLAGTLFWFWNATESQVTDLAHLLQEQQERLERQSEQMESLISALPVEDASRSALKRDLMSKPETITLPGILGGTMRIHSESDIRILDDSWVYARFDDGHIQASGLFRYEKGQDGRTTWTLLESRIH